MTRKERIELEKFSTQFEAKSRAIFNEIDSELESILVFLKEGKMDVKIALALTNYLIIRCVGMVEHFFRNLVRQYIDEKSFSVKGIIQNDEISISLLDLEEIKKSGIVTSGRIVAHSFNFQNLDELDSVISKLLGGKSFFSRFSEYVEKMALSDPPLTNNAYQFKWQEFHELFDIRHDIVHRLKTGKTIDFETLAKFKIYVGLFCMVAEFIFEEEDLIRNKVKLEQDNSKSYQERVKRIEDFKTWTKS